MRNFFELKITPRRILTLFLVGAVGCGGGDPSGPQLRKDVMWDLTVFPQVMSLPVGDTLPLVVRPLDYNGAVIDQDVSISYVSSDTSYVKVSPTGVITAVRSTSGQSRYISVAVRAGAVTRKASVFVGVTAERVEVDSISIRPIVGEPVVTVMGASAILSARTFFHGTEVPNVFVRVDFDNPKRTGGFFLYGTVLGAGQPGKVLIRATTFVNGKLLSDSVEYRARYREYTDLTVARTPTGALSTKFGQLYPTNIYLSTNAQVDIINNLTTPVGVTFERPNDVKGSSAGAVGGDIAEIQPGKRVARWFPEPGDYFFTVQSGSESRRISVTVKDIPSL